MHNFFNYNVSKTDKSRKVAAEILRIPDSKTAALNQCHVGQASTAATTIEGDGAAGATTTANNTASADDAACECTAATDIKTNP